MVTNVTNFSRSGLYDWMAQRVSGVVLAASVIFLLGYLIAHPNISYADWHGLVSQVWILIFSLLPLVALGVHAWVGMWTLST
ncbi:succinate dehydrogenase, hydrophobic membrane anchor protein, partial [Pseudomonas aeruginosa]